MSTGDTRGRFVWYDLMTTDPDGAKEFYTKLSGWGTAPWEGGEEPYTMWLKGERPVGGVMELPEQARAQGAPPHWLAYVATVDVDATASRTKELGGGVLVEPMDIPSVGRFTVLQDPQGAVFAAFSSEGEATPSSGEVGEVSWHELATTDHGAAYEFYADLFGWTEMDSFDMGPEAGVYRIFGVGDRMLGGMYDKPPEMPAPPHWLCYIRVPDVNEAVERVKASGGQVLNGPMEVPGGDWVAQCMDPQGAAFAVHQKAA